MTTNPEIQQYSLEQAIADEITINSDGQGFISAKGVARLVGLSGVSLLGVNRFPSKLAETFTQQGVDTVNRPFNEVALTLIAEYYAYHAQKTTEEARQVYRTLAAIGARSWMQKVKGWSSEQQAQPALPPADIRVTNLINALDRLGFDMDNPRFNQQLKDLTGDILGLTPQLRGSEWSLSGVEGERWCGVVERAEELGYPVSQVLRHRSQLGKWVKKYSSTEPRQERRLCSGTHRLVNVYLVNDDLDGCIRDYFDSHF